MESDRLGFQRLTDYLLGLVTHFRRSVSELGLPNLTVRERKRAIEDRWERERERENGVTQEIIKESTTVLYSEEAKSRVVMCFAAYGTSPAPADHCRSIDLLDWQRLRWWHRSDHNKLIIEIRKTDLQNEWMMI